MTKCMICTKLQETRGYQERHSAAVVYSSGEVTYLKINIHSL